MDFFLFKRKFILNTTDITFICLVILFIVVAILQSLTAHAHYYTNNWDLGFHNQLMYKFAHFMRPSTTLWSSEHELTNCFGDHFTLLMPINSQLYWLFGSYALLVAQIGYCVIGATGIYKLIIEKCENYSLAICAVFLFFTHYSLYAALSFDAHDNVYGVMFLPWIFYFFYKNNLRWFIISLLIFLIAREDLSLIGMMCGIALLLLEWKEKKQYGLICFFVSLGYFLLTYKLIMPMLSPLGGAYTAWRFNHLGNSITEVLSNFIIKPNRIFPLFYDTPEKQEKVNFFFLTSGVFLVFQPKFIFLFLPTMFTTLLSDGWTLWGNMCHYNIIFSVMLPVITVFTISKIKNEIRKKLLLLIVAGLNFSTLNSISFLGWTKFNRIFSSGYYKSRTNLSELSKAIGLIPDDASVSATSHLTPHIAFREKAYFFPDIKNADFILINEDDKEFHHYPFNSPEEFSAAVQKVYNDSTYQTVYNEKKVVLFKKKK